MPTQPGPAGWSVFIPTGDAPDWKSFMESDEFYKQDIEDINTGLKKAQDRLGIKQGFDVRAYDLEVAQAMASANSGGDYGVATAQAQAALAKEKAAHDNANRAEYLREWLGGRGMIDSGQNAWEQNERQYQFDIYNRGIDTDLQGRIQAANDARAAAQAGLQARLAQMSLGQEQDLQEFAWAAEDLPLQAAKDRGAAGFNLWQRLNENGSLKQPGINGVWDPETQLYVTADGTTYAIGADGKPYKKAYTPPAGPATSTAPTSPTTSDSGGGGYYQLPGTNPIPGAGWGYE